MSNIDNRSKASARVAGCEGKARLHPRRSAFTLVELLIVILIIGILVGLLVPAVNIVYINVQKSAIAMEVEAISSAIEQYKNKYGEYPPDGSSEAVFRRHVKKVFSNAVPTELDVLTNYAVRYPNLTGVPANGVIGVMDPPEALVFFLGGFSSDETHPFTGPGGPLFLQLQDGTRVNSDHSPSSAIVSVQYNTDRNEPIYDFKQAQLTLETNAAGTITYSNDERDILGAAANTMDCLPTYRSGGSRQTPFVYFDSRTYTVGGSVFNSYSPAAALDKGVARPYRSKELNTTASGNPDKYYRYMNDRSFQLISAGLDDSFGGLPSTSTETVFFLFPTGEQLVFPSSGSPTISGGRYFETSGIPSAQLDNATNFSDGVLENALEN